jgi:hypothetical protein
MKLTSVTFLALIIIAIIGCNDDTVGPNGPNDGKVEGEYIVYVMDDKNAAVGGAFITICPPYPYGTCSMEYTNFFGMTDRHHYDTDSSFKKVATITKQGYVPTVDTFTIEQLPLNNIVIILPSDSGYIQGSVIAEAQDMAGHPLVDAAISWSWYPGPAWKESLTKTDYTKVDGRTNERLILIDSSRNQLIVNTWIFGYESVCDTLAIISDSTREILFKLKPE